MVLWLVVCASGCSSGQSVTTPLDVDLAAAPVTFRLRLLQTGLRSSLEVEVLVHAGGRALPSPLHIELPHRWAGYDDLDDDLTGFVAFGSDGTPLHADREPGRLVVQHGGEHAVAVTYRIVPLARSLRQRSRFHAVGTPDYFFGYGRNLFIWPAHLAEGSTPIGIVFEQSSAPATWASTLGLVAPHGVLCDRSWRHVFDAAYMAGHVRVFGDLGNREGTAVVVDPRLGDVEERIWGTVRRIESYAQGRWGPPQIPTTVALVLARTEDPAALTGSGRPGGFVLELGERVDPSSNELIRLVTHEHLHRYIGSWLRFAARDELLTLWFKEGVVDYLAAAFAVRSGALSTEGFYEALSESLTGYLANERVGEPLEGSPSDLWGSSAMRRLPYQQGFPVGLHLDLLLRESDDSLDEAVGDLIHESAARSPVTATDLQRFFETRLDRDLTWLFDGHIARGEALPIRQWLADVGLTMRQLARSTPYYGLEVDSAYNGTWHIVAIDPLGPAASLPLSAGDRLVEAPVVPTSGYGRYARLTVERDGRPVRLSIPPVQGESRIWSVQQEDDRFEQVMRW